MSSRSLAGIANRIPAQVLIVTSALIQYSGAAVAVFAFSVVEPASVAWWRGFVGALVLCARPRPRNPQGCLLFRYRAGLHEFVLLRGHFTHSFGGDSVPGISWPRGGCGVPRPWLGAASCRIFCALWGLRHWWSRPGFERSANTSGIGLGHGGRGLVGGIYPPRTKSCVFELRDDQPFAGLCVQRLDLRANSGPRCDGRI